MTDAKRWEVYITHEPAPRAALWRTPLSDLRFVARFATLERAHQETEWYQGRGYQAVVHERKTAPGYEP